ncbi:MAG: cytochrome c peroxidase [Caldilineaceae bacterium]
MIVMSIILFALTGSNDLVTAETVLTPTEQLGQLIFFDQNLSLNENQACAACHGPTAGWTGPEETFNAHGAVYEGSIPGAFGARKPPSSAYATQSPIFYLDKKGQFVGGNFWDGRATGENLGNPAADQAQASPFINPVEQALLDPAAVVEKVCAADYADLFKQVWGNAICDSTNIATAWDGIALSIASYEASPDVNAFTSKFDYSLKGQYKLTQQERLGFALFKGKAKCSACHTVSGPGSLFTDYTYDNLGLPKNPENPIYNTNPDFIDLGLAGFLMARPEYSQFAPENEGKFKVPTLRNVAKGSCEAEPDNPNCITKAYGHNGYFKSLAEIVHFYNTRDVETWPAPEVPQNVNTAELGNLGLSADEEAAVVAFLTTLSDGYIPTRMKAASAEEIIVLEHQIFLPAVILDPQ